MAEVVAPYGITKVVLQPDSKVLFASRYYAPQFPAQFGRLNSNGSKDTSFKIGTGTNRAVRAIAVLPNGQLMIGGDFSTYNNVYAKGIARLNANGSLDKSFKSGKGISYNAATIYPDVQTISADKSAIISLAAISMYITALEQEVCFY